MLSERLLGPLPEDGGDGGDGGHVAAGYERGGERGAHVSGYGGPRTSPAPAQTKTEEKYGFLTWFGGVPEDGEAA